MEREAGKKDAFVKVLEFVTFFPGIAGLLVASGVLLGQVWQWVNTGEWQAAPIAQFVPPGLLRWAIQKEGGLFGLKKLVQTLLSLHASLWFFAVGLVITLVMYEIAKPWLKDTGDR